VVLTPAATPETNPVPPAPGAETKLLMLVDPRAAVHATMGVLPAQTLAIPSDQYQDVLAGLELTVSAMPLLRPAGGLAVPLPAIAGFNWSWIEEDPGPVWEVDPELTPATAGAVWQYSPQSLTEGWLRLNPELLQFRLANTEGEPVVVAGTTMALALTVKNARKAPISFVPATIVGETTPKQGSVFYIHFGSLVALAQVAAIQPSAAGWQFQQLTDAQYGSYWAASPVGATFSLAPGASFTVMLANVTIATATMAQARVYFDYYNTIGDDDGIDIAVLAVQPPPPPPPALQPVVPPPGT
jgi:hypothetical protein